MDRRKGDHILSPSEAMKVVGFSLFLTGLMIAGWLAVAVLLIANGS